MKSTSGWNENGNGSNESGFSGLPGSLRSIFHYHKGIFLLTKFNLKYEQLASF
jgi:hypothetical protein